MAKSAATPTVLLAYIPVLHQGYWRFIEQNTPPAREIYVLCHDFTQQYRPLVKDIRALEPKLIAQALQQWYPKLPVHVLEKSNLEHLAEIIIIAPDEDITRHVLQEYLPEATIRYDTIFLRWDHQKSLAPDRLDNIATVSASQIEQTLFAKAQIEAEKSSDWWRQVGAVLVTKDGQTVLSDHNHHLPSAHSPYVAGDPRANFHKGEHIELTTAIHAEAAVIAAAAKQGVATQGASLYVTTFPCPTCAKLIAQAGVKKVYFSEGYAVLDGLDVLQEAEVAIAKLTPSTFQP